MNADNLNAVLNLLPAAVTPGQAAIIAAAFNATALLLVGLLTLGSAKAQRDQAERQLNRQLDEQRKQLAAQLTEQRKQLAAQLTEQREQTTTQSAEQRKLTLIELREETARLFRQEKKAIYVRMLHGGRAEQQLWQGLAADGPGELLPDLRGLLQRAGQLKVESDEVVAEVELVASHAVHTLSQEFQNATSALLLRLIHETQQRLGPGERGDPATFRQVQIGLRDELARQDLTDVYQRLREQMRSELFDLALDPSLRPTPQEQDDLRIEVQGLSGPGATSRDPLR